MQQQLATPTQQSQLINPLADAAPRILNVTTTHNTIACCYWQLSCWQHDKKLPAACCCCCTWLCQERRHNIRTACNPQAAAVRRPGSAQQSAACCISCTSCCQYRVSLLDSLRGLSCIFLPVNRAPSCSMLPEQLCC